MNAGGTRGFTLIELIIALALIGMAMAIGFAALRLAVRSMESTDRLVEELETMRVAYTVMQRQLPQARPLREVSTQREVSFHGEGRQLDFVAPAPLQGERLMGLYRYRLRFEPAGEAMNLLLEYQPYAPGAAPAWQGAVESELLMGGIGTGEFSYFGAGRDEVEGWQPRWNAEERLPRMVRITLLRKGAGSEPLELVVALPVERAG